MWFDYKLYNLQNGEYEVVISSDDKKYGGSHELENKIYVVENHELVISLPSTII